ncbi:uncharacterized protein [Henckelia pumila]|uniref:uncharacterized protein n=3 Tax=Henckelia pumila TaxID=405737 RepID=UPI003C6E68E6
MKYYLRSCSIYSQDVHSLCYSLCFEMARRHDPRAVTPPPPPPAPQVDIGGQVLAGLARILERHVDAPVARSETTYEQFRKMNPKDFAGTTDPLIAEGWIRSLEVIFRYMQMGDPDRVRCAVFLLQDDAALWWEGMEKIVNPATLPWAEFKKLFFEKYFTADVRARLKTEFMSLRQGDLSVAQFVVKFERGCHFVPLIGDDEKEKLEHFLVGLRPTIRRDVLMAEPSDYASALRRALRSEQTLRDISAEAHGKRPFPHQGHSQQQQHGKKPYHGPPRQQGQQAPQGRQAQRQVPPKAGEKPICQFCHRPHFGKCLKDAGVCFKCKKPGHMSTHCPELRRPVQGRVFVMEAEQADPDTTLLTGEDFVEETEGRDLLG